MQKTESRSIDGADDRGFIALVRALVDSGLDIAHSTVRMAASEGRLVLQRVLVRLGYFVAGLFIAAMGLLLVLVGAAVVLSRVAGIEEWLGFVIVGVVTLAAGALFAARAMRRLSQADIAFPKTIAEFDEDFRMLRANRGEPENGVAHAPRAAGRHAARTWDPVAGPGAAP